METLATLKVKFESINNAREARGLAPAPFCGDRRKKADWEAACAAAQEAFDTVPTADHMAVDRARVIGAADAALLARIRGTARKVRQVRVWTAEAKEEAAREAAKILAADFATDRAAMEAERRAKRAAPLRASNPAFAAALERARDRFWAEDR